MEQQVKLWDLKLRSFVWSTALKEPNTDVAAIDFSADGMKVLVAGYGQGALILNASDGRILTAVRDTSAGKFDSARFDPNGQMSVIGDQNGSALLWRSQGGQYDVLRGHAGGVRAAEFSPSGSFVMTAGADATAKIWDAANGELLDTVAEHPSQMPEVPYLASSFSPDGRWLLTGSTDGTFRLWALDEESRSPNQISDILKCRVPWQLSQDNLMPFGPDAAACARLGG